ncbi:autotransporter outer membrane beta-barrel domain-containing protein [Sulfitobacter sabulilitoris]|uniref:Autotransporter outer membrane beta-barrel domain-containing protein n=1 Tax=Sulfitobacter sabulilitoris TaxID=2562655 RepID=A0A5S3PC92_9RHOB|nr:autotransporter outer membrane beta-barrel domain-containing protein [Sulfitobacter sabulilitoris]TMM51316.1 autotransporter outer membrane beta-barrel domain-containing protein [Sulfitobacter sabulilitoris]
MHNFNVRGWFNFGAGPGGLMLLMLLAIISILPQGARAQSSPPAFTIFFSPDQIGPGGTTALTHTIDNGAAPTAAGDLAFTHTLPAGVTLANPSNASTTCSGTGSVLPVVNAAAGGDSISFSNGGIAAGASCTVTVNVTSSTAGTSTSVTGDLTSSAGNSGTATDDLTVTTARPGFSKSFAPDTVSLGDTSTLTYVIDNSANAGAVINLDFTENLPAGIEIASPANVATTCGTPAIPATLTADSGTSLVVLDANGTAGFPAVAAGATCTVTLDVTATGTGELVAISGQLSADFEAVGASSATLTVATLPTDAPVLTKQFLDDPAGPGGTATIRFTIRNNNRDNGATDISFSDDLDAMLSGAARSASAGLVDPCGAGSSVTGTSTISFSNGTLAAGGASCSFDVTVNIPAGATAGDYLNTTSVLTSTVNGNTVTSAAASDTLVVTDSVAPGLAFAFTDGTSGGETTVTLDFTNRDSFSVLTDGAFQLKITDVVGFPASVVLPPENDTCSGLMELGFEGFNGQALSYTGATLAAGASCAVSVVIRLPADMPSGTFILTSSAPVATVGGTSVTGTAATGTLTVNPGSLGLSFAKSFSVDTAVPGSEVGLTFVISDPSDGGGAVDISFSDNLDAFQTGSVLTSVVSNTCGGTVTGETTSSIGFSGGSVASGGSCEIATIITLGSTDTGSKTNTTSNLTAASASGGAASEQAGTAASDTLTVDTVLPVQLGMEFIDDPVLPGAPGTVRYTLTNLNGGAFEATGIFFSHNLADILPGTPDFTVSGLPQSNVCGAGSTLQGSGASAVLLTGGSLPAGASCTFDLAYDVPAGAGTGRYRSTTSATSATIDGGSRTGAAASDTVTVGSSVEGETTLTLTKTFASDTVLQGDTAAVTFNISNTGAEAASDLAFSDDLEAFLAGTTLASTTVNTCGGASTGGSATSFDYANGTLAAGASCDISIVLNISATAPLGTATNTTSAMTGTAAGSAVLNADAATDTIEIRSSSAPTFSKSFSPSTVNTNSETVLTYQISNPPGAATLNALRFSDDLASRIPGAVASAGSLSGVCGSGSALSVGGTVSLSEGVLAAGESCTFSVRVAIATPPPGTVTSTTSSLENGGLTVAPPASASVTVNPAPPTLSKAFGPASIFQGGTSTVVLTIDNSASADAASDISVNDVFPAGVRIRSGSTRATTCLGGSLITTANSIGYRAGTVPAGATCTVSVEVTAEAVGSYVNTTSELSTAFGNSPAASATLVVTAAPPPVFTKQFNAASIVQGETSRLTFSIDNSGALVDVSSLAFTDSLPAGLTIAPTPSATSSCDGGTITATPGASSLSYSGGAAVAGLTCGISVNVTSSTVGTVVNTTGDLTSSLGNSGSASASLTVAAAPAPEFSQRFVADTIEQGATSRLIFTLINRDALIDATGLAFTNTLPAGMTLSTLPQPETNCLGATLTAPAGSNALSFSGGTLQPGRVCNLSVVVTSSTIGAAVNTSGDLTSSLGSSGTSSATLDVTAAPVPLFSKFFVPNTIVQGETTVLRLEISNSRAKIDATGGAFTDVLPAGVTLAASPDISTTCASGVVTGVAGGDTLSLSGATIAAESACSVQATVTSSTVGAAVNTAGDLTTSLGNSAGATAILTVTAADVPTFTKVFGPTTIVQGETSTLTFTVNNGTAAIDVGSLSFTDAFPAGMTVAAPANAVSTCTGGTFAANAGDGAVSFSGGTVGARATCTLQVDVTATLVGDAVNTSGALTSTLGDSGTAAAILSVTAADAPAFSKAFEPASIVQGSVSTLTFTLDNAPAAVEVRDLAFIDILPEGVLIATPSAVSSTCTGAAISATEGGNRIDLTGGSLAAGANCTLSVNVTSSTAGAAVNTTGNLTSSLGDSGTASATLTVTGAPAPGFTKVFSPATIEQGGTSTLSFTLDNASALVVAGGLSFNDSFPTGMTVATPANATTTCTAGAVAAAPGDAGLVFSGGTLDPGATCSVQVDVTSTTIGAAVNTSGSLTSSLGDSGTASATLTVTRAPAPGFTMGFVPGTIVQGGISSLTFTVDNAASQIAASGLGFVETLPAGVTVAGVPNVSNTCSGGTIGAEPGTVSISFAGGSVAAGGRCAVTVDVTSVVVGSYMAAGPTLNASTGTVSAAAAALTVDVNPNGSVILVQQGDAPGNYVFSSSLSALNVTLATLTGSGSVGPIEVPAGNYTVLQSRPQGVGNSTARCDDDDSSVDAATGTVTLAVAPFETVTCTFTSVETVQKTVDTINNFLTQRNNLILSNGPSDGRRKDRLNGGGTGNSTVSFQNGDLTSMVPFSFNLRSASDGNYRFATSLSAMREAGAKFLLAHDGIDGNSMLVPNSKFDMWFEVSYNKFSASQGSDGHFAIGYVGADYLFSPDLLAGALVQFDDMDNSSDIQGSSVSGNGWMIGPYVTTRLAPNLIFDGRLAYGKSTNKISPFNTYTDSFRTDRFLVSASLSGSYDWNDWTVSPNATLAYIEERQKGYTDSLNVAIPGQTVSLGQLSIGPDFSTSFVAGNQVLYQPRFSINGIYNFGDTDGVVLSDIAQDSTTGWRGRIEAGVTISNRHGTRLEIGANYDGIGQADFESYGATVKLTIPLQ